MYAGSVFETSAGVERETKNKEKGAVVEPDYNCQVKHKPWIPWARTHLEVR
jgi:hypothetical protein